MTTNETDARELSDDMPYPPGHELDGVSKPLPFQPEARGVREDAERLLEWVGCGIDGYGDACSFNVDDLVQILERYREENMNKRFQNCDVCNKPVLVWESRDTLEAKLVRLGEADYPDDRVVWQWIPGDGLIASPRHCVKIGQWHDTPHAAVKKAREEME